MSFEVTGKFVAKFNIVQRTESFKTREFVIEKTDDINGRSISNYIKFQCVQDKTALPDRFNIGDDVKVFFNIRGTKWVKDGKENYITNLDAWRMEQVKLGQPGNDTAQSQAPASFSTGSSDVVDDLPF
jgi:hypothetical protein